MTAVPAGDLEAHLSHADTGEGNGSSVVRSRGRVWSLDGTKGAYHSDNSDPRRSASGPGSVLRKPGEGPGDEFLPNIEQMLERRIANEEDEFEGHRAADFDYVRGAGTTGHADRVSHHIVHELVSKLRWRPKRLQARAEPRDYSGYFRVIHTLARLLEKGRVLVDVSEQNTDGIIDRFLDAITTSVGDSAALMSAEHRTRVRTALRERESEFPDAVGASFHMMLGMDDCFDEEPLLALARLSRPVNFNAPDDLPTRFMWLLLGSENHGDDIVVLGEGIALLMSDARFHDAAVQARTHADIVELIQDSGRRMEEEITSAGTILRMSGSTSESAGHEVPVIDNPDEFVRERIISLTHTDAGHERHPGVRHRGRTLSWLGSVKEWDPDAVSSPGTGADGARRKKIEADDTHAVHITKGDIPRLSTTRARGAIVHQARRPIDWETVESEVDDAKNARLNFFEWNWSGGVVRDFKETIQPLWCQEFSYVALHLKRTWRAIVLILFAVVAPAISFGALSAQLTKGQIGVVETMLGSAIFGSIYALFGGQPMMIIGYTGPIVIFTGLLYNVCVFYDVPFLATNVWVSVWILIFSVFLAGTRSARCIDYVTRFTDEIFAAHISGIFILEASGGIRRYFQVSEYSREVALLALVAAVGTCWLSLTLRELRRSRLLRPNMRELLSDFSSTLAIVVMSCIDRFALHDVRGELVSSMYTVKPSGWELKTTTGRAWLVDPMDLNGKTWVIGAAAIPAFVASVLLSLDNWLTYHAVNSPANKLRHGSAADYDTVFMGIVALAASLFGMPWLVAADVRSVQHVLAMAEKETVHVRRLQGVVHEHVLSVTETRWSGFLVHVLLGLVTVCLIGWIGEIPMSVLYGFFMFMGITTLWHNQLVERLQLFVTDPAMYEPTHYVRNCPMVWTMTFTACQFFLFVALVLFKGSPVGLFFPLFIAALPVFRFIVLPRLVPVQYITILDEEEEMDDFDAHMHDG